MAINNVEEKQYLGLLLLTGEQGSMIDRYLKQGTVYVLEVGWVKAECMAIDVGDSIQKDVAKHCTEFSGC